MPVQIESLELAKINERYTDISYGQGVLIPPNVNIIIDDVGLCLTDQEELEMLLTQKLLFLNSESLMPTINSRISNLLDDTAAVFPLNGAKYVRDRLENPVIKGAFIKVVRPADNLSARNVSQKEECLDLLQKDKPERIEIIDDVEVGGATAKAIKEFVESKMGRTFCWGLTVWLMAYPRNKVSSGVEGMKSTLASVLYQRQNGTIPPTNSISTWLMDSEKGDAVARSYSEKYANKPKDFLNYISEMKKRR